jgi:hypothetical protein
VRPEKWWQSAVRRDDRKAMKNSGVRAVTLARKVVLYVARTRVAAQASAASTRLG